MSSPQTATPAPSSTQSPEGGAESGSSLAEALAKIDAGDLDAVEELWLKRIESRPRDLDWFVEITKEVTRVDSDVAEVLLQTLDDQLGELGHGEQRLEILRRFGRTMYENVELHDAIVESLRQVHDEHSALDDLMQHVGLDKAPQDIPKTWKKVEKLEGLLDYDVGTVVRMKGKGSGHVEEINLVLENFLVKFQSGLELRVGFAAAAKMLTALPKTHVLRRKLDAPEELEELRDEAPGELLRLALESEGKSLTGSDVKALLDGIVSAKQWNRFWSKARKHPQVISDPNLRHGYAWAESTADAHGTLLEGFDDADVPERLQMLRRDAKRDEELRELMSERLWEQAESLAGRQPGAAAEIWLQLDKSGVLPDGEVDWTPEKLIAGADDPVRLYAQVDDRSMRRRVYEIAREARDDWPETFAEALWQETDARALDYLAQSLLEEEPDRFWSFFDGIVSQPTKAPAAFTWLLERAAENEEWMQRNALRLMRQLLTAMTSDAFSPYRAARLVPLTESGGTLPRLLDHLSVDQAETALDTVKTSPGLENYQREPLANAIHLRFPDLHQEKEAPLYATPESIREKRAELKKITETEIPENRQAIEEARELGDLRENFEYHAARRRHEYLSDRAGKLDDALRRARPIDPSNVKDDEVSIGAEVTFENGDGDSVHYTLLGPWESDPENRVLSNESDLGEKLLGRKKGETVELPEGDYEIVKIEPWTE